MTTIPGLHHVTAISGPPQANLDFYAGPMRQRLVKRTVNFDAPDTYHLYYADRDGTPGTVLTFFPFVDAGPGRAGPGMASAVAYAAPSLDPWMDALALEAVDFEGPFERMGERALALRDPDGMRVELVEAGGGSGLEDRGFHSVTLWVDDPAPTARVLTEVMGYAEAGSETEGGTERLRLAAPGDARGRIVDVIRSDAPSIGRQGAGTIHHVAFRARSYEEQEHWRERVAAAGLDVTPVIDRQYFRAIYFREPGGILFEIATDPPGFDADEPRETMGSELKLPDRYEPMRGRIERTLPPLRLPEREGA